MKRLNLAVLLLVVLLVVFLEAAVPWGHRWLGAQPDWLPGLVVYAALSGGLLSFTLVAVCGGLWFDALSVQTLGVSVLPLFLVGWGIFLKQEMILREQPYAQFLVGALASAATPLLNLLLLVSLGEAPLLGWGSLWQWLVVALAGGAVTPVWFRLFTWLHRALNYQPAVEPAFREDREIKRGRS